MRPGTTYSSSSHFHTDPRRAVPSVPLGSAYRPPGCLAPAKDLHTSGELMVTTSVLLQRHFLAVLPLCSSRHQELMCDMHTHTARLLPAEEKGMAKNLLYFSISAWDIQSNVFSEYCSLITNGENEKSL